MVLGNSGEQELGLIFQECKQLRGNLSSQVLHNKAELSMATMGELARACSAQMILLSFMWSQVETSFSCVFSQHSEQY